MTRRIRSSTLRKNFDIRKTSQEQKNYNSSARTRLVAEKAVHICYEPRLPPAWRQRKRHSGRRYRSGGTSLIKLPQVINLKSAVDFAASIGTPLVAHLIVHWVGTDAGDDPNGELFAQGWLCGSVGAALPSQAYGHARGSQAVKLRWTMLTFSFTYQMLG